MGESQLFANLATLAIYIYSREIADLEISTGKSVYLSEYLADGEILAFKTAENCSEIQHHWNNGLAYPRNIPLFDGIPPDSVQDGPSFVLSLY